MLDWILNRFGIPASLLNETKTTYSSYQSVLRLFEAKQTELKQSLTRFVDKILEPIYEQGRKTMEDFQRLKRWQYRDHVVYAHTKSEARALLKKRIGKLPIGAGADIRGREQ